jgi:aminoglycoside phosphotransferase (APT) family kinase protein
MEVQEDVPFSLEEVTADWLSKGFTETGLLASGAVKAIDVQRIGEQVGFNGEVAMVTPHYEGDAAAAPDRLVLKIPTASKNRILGQTMGLYEKEIRFYRDLQPGLSIRTPRHYYSALDIADDPDVILERLEGMNKLPIWMIRGLMAAASWFVSGHPRKYVLLIEDLSGYRMGDQEAGCPEADIESIIVAMARLHAQYWASAELPRMSWIAPYAVTSRIMQMRYLQAYKDFMSDQGAGLTAAQQKLVQWLKVHGTALTEKFGEEPATLLHGDFRLDNICFDDEAGEIILFDWQTMQAGPGASDLAYFISATMPVETDEGTITALIDQYHGELGGHGVDIERDQLQRQYETGMLCMLHRVLPTVYLPSMDLDEERGLPLLKAWLSRIFKRLDAIDHQKLTADLAASD